MSGDTMMQGDSTPRFEVYSFDHDHGVPASELVSVLGGKGAGLSEMTRALDMPVPPGFTLALSICRIYWTEGWPQGLDDVLAEHVTRLEAHMGRRFGDSSDPLLLAVRSGAPTSMPGMMDTILNIGMNDASADGLARVSGDPVFAWDSYRRFLEMFGATVMGVEPELLKVDDEDRDLSAIQSQVALLKARIREHAGRDCPTTAVDQLKEAIIAVWDSWESPRAKAFREAENMVEDTGTAVNVQVMVFGNRGSDSGTGVVFTRSPVDGTNVLYGDYLPQAQGEEVVAGTARTYPIGELADHLPDAYDALVAALTRLEHHYRDMCDVEFTIEQGNLWLLQTRVGKRGAVASVRCAVEMVDDPNVRLTPAEAVARVPLDIRRRAYEEVIAAVGRTRPEHPLIATGLGVSAGRVSGRVVLSSIAAVQAVGDIILVRSETSPEDIAGMASSVGILTTTGGLVSHAAVVARGWGLPAVVGAHELKVTKTEIRLSNGHSLTEGDVITIDGESGEVWLGDATHDDVPIDDAAATAVVSEHLPELLTLNAWAQREGAMT